MLSSLTLENFKAFRKLDKLKVKPITVLCGSNSCGKSSILQSILLLKQTLESQNASHILLLNGRLVHLGILRNIIYSKKQKNNIVFKFSFKNLKNQGTKHQQSRSIRMHRPLSYIIRWFDITKDDRDKEIYCDFNVSISELSENNDTKDVYVSNMKVNEIRISAYIAKNRGKKIYKGSIELKSLEKSNEYKLSWDNLRIGGRIQFNGKEKQKHIEKSGHIITNIEFANILLPLLPSMTIANIHKKDGGDKSFNQEFILAATHIIFADIYYWFKHQFSTFRYLGPLREEPSRRYIYEDEIVEIGVKGENAAFIYSVEKDNEIKDHYYYEPSIDTFQKSDKPMSLHKAINKWLNVMNIQDFNAESSDQLIKLFLNSNTTSKKTMVNIADVGFGVSQIFPIILEGLRMEKHNTLLLEQPEIHLHPSLQMQLSDFFISMALSGKNLIIETHSDHMVNRFIRRIVEDTEYNISDLVGIYFISPSSSGSKVEEIQISEESGIVNWPKGFFDQSADEQEKILRSAINNRRKI